jgi:hypothetical protein
LQYWFTHRLDTSRLLQLYLAQSPELCRLSARQVPRAPLPLWGVTPTGVTQQSHRKALPSPHRSYGLMGQSKTLPLSSVHPITVGLCRLSSVPAESWTFPALSPQSLYRCLDPYPVAPLRCPSPFLPEEQRPHLTEHKFGSPKLSVAMQLQRRKKFSGLQSFHYVQAPTLARPPGCTHR